MIKVYQYSKCGTCKKALKWLDARGIDYESVDIVHSPPSASILKKIQELAEVPVTKLFNTSGQVYRQGGYKDKLVSMNDGDALRELAAQGKLIKRPLVFGDGIALIGFKEPEYESAFDA